MNSIATKEIPGFFHHLESDNTRASLIYFLGTECVDNNVEIQISLKNILKSMDSDNSKFYVVTEGATSEFSSKIFEIVNNDFERNKNIKLVSFHILQDIFSENELNNVILLKIC